MDDTSFSGFKDVGFLFCYYFYGYKLDQHNARESTKQIQHMRCVRLTEINRYIRLGGRVFVVDLYRHWWGAVGGSALSYAMGKRHMATSLRSINVMM